MHQYLPHLKLDTHGAGIPIFSPTRHEGLDTRETEIKQHNLLVSSPRACHLTLGTSYKVTSEFY